MSRHRATEGWHRNGLQGRLRIAFVVHDYNDTFGHSRYVRELARRFSVDHEVHVYASRIDVDDDVPIHFHRVSAWRLNALTTILSFLVCGSIAVGGAAFDIVHGQGMCIWRNDVVTVHQVMREWAAARRRHVGLRQWREWLFGCVIAAMEATFYRAARRSSLIAVSSRVGQDLRRHYVPNADCATIYHGVDLGRFSPWNCENQRAVQREVLGIGGDLLFLFVGDMRKGAHACLAALSTLGVGRLIFVSFGSPDEWERNAARLGVGDRVSFEAGTREVEKYYAAADVVLFPSPSDAFGMVVSEAMASGLPVIVSQAAGASELVKEGRNGLILRDPTDHGELASHMATLAQDPGLRASLGAAARETMMEHSWDRAAAQTLEVYRCRLQARPGS